MIFFLQVTLVIMSKNSENVAKAPLGDNDEEMGAAGGSPDESDHSSVEDVSDELELGALPGFKCHVCGVQNRRKELLADF